MAGKRGRGLRDGGSAFLNVIPGDVEEPHLADELRQHGLEERLTARLLDVALRVFGHEVAESPFVEDDAFLRKLVVGFDGGVGVDAEFRRILAHAGYAVESLIDASQDLVAQPVGYLQEDGLVVIEWHSFVCFVLDEWLLLPLQF